MSAEVVFERPDRAAGAAHGLRELWRVVDRLAEENAALDEAKKNGIKLINFSAADDKVLSAAFESAANEWAASLDKRNKHGSEALAAVKKAIAESKQ